MGMKQELEKRIDQYRELGRALLMQDRTDFCRGYCYFIRACFGIDVHLDINFETQFPELWSLNPIEHWVRNPDYWFSTDNEGISQRIALLDKAIAITQEKLNTFNSLPTD